MLPGMMQAGFYASTPGGGALSDQWRLSFTDGADSELQLLEVQMRGTAGGANQCTGGSASASSSDGSYPPANAFDGLYPAGGYWRTAGNTNGDGAWLQYTFAAPVTVAEIMICQNWVNCGPRVFDVQYWDGAAWQTHWTVTTGPWNGAAQEARVMTKP